jgi:hypothetical protein
MGRKKPWRAGGRRQNVFPNSSVSQRSFIFATINHSRNLRHARYEKPASVGAIVLWVTWRKFGGFNRRCPSHTVSHSSVGPWQQSKPQATCSILTHCARTMRLWLTFRMCPLRILPPNIYPESVVDFLRMARRNCERKSFQIREKYIFLIIENQCVCTQFINT